MEKWKERENFFESGEYFVGEFKNNFMHGKGVLYEKMEMKYIMVIILEEKKKVVDINLNLFFMGGMKNFQLLLKMQIVI